jgi:hypothetical protein
MEFRERPVSHRFAGLCAPLESGFFHGKRRDM